MEFVEIDENKYRKFWENHPEKTFISSPEVGKLRKNNGWRVHFVGVEKNMQYTDFHFISFDGIYTITISGTDNHITKKSF